LVCRMTSPVRSFFDFELEELKKHFSSHGKEKFRAQQLFQWVYQKSVLDPQLMTNLSKDFRAQLLSEVDLMRLPIVEQLDSVDGTKKFLFDIGDSKTVESVLIPSKDRLTLCVSSEVGCNMACRFCFTGKQKLSRRLTAGEIVGQFFEVSNLIQPRRITNVVFMGMGEPLDNPDAVFRAIKILNSPWGFNLSRKRVTVSTSGLVPMIPLVAEAGARLAVSLNATTNEIRDYVMPINKKYPMNQLLESCRQYVRETGDRVTFEYVLLKGVTDSLEDARRLQKISRQVPCKINIIPFNEHPGSGFERPSDETVDQFHNELMRLGVHVLLRRTKGRDIFAACGQLRSRYEGHPERMSVS